MVWLTSRKPPNTSTCVKKIKLAIIETGTSSQHHHGRAEIKVCLTVILDPSVKKATIYR